jgi:hypothetical protein
MNYVSSRVASGNLSCACGLCKPLRFLKSPEGGYRDRLFGVVVFVVDTV